MRTPNSNKGRATLQFVAQAVTLFACLFNWTSGLAASRTSNGNGLGYTDVGIWYETLYEPRMWALGSFPDRSIKYLPLCPNPIVYTGNWTYNISGSTSGWYNNDLHTSQTAGDSVQYSFTGTGIRILTEPYSGNAQSLTIKIDNIVVPFSPPNSTDPHLVKLYENTNLTSTTHTLLLTHNDSTPLSIDAFEYTYSWIDIDDLDNCYASDTQMAGQNPTVIQFCNHGQTDSTQCSLGDCFAHVPDWVRGSLNSFQPGNSWTNYNGYWHDSYTWSSTVGAVAKFWFKGNAIKIIGDTTTGNVTANVVVDGVGQTYSAVIHTQSARHQQTLCYIPIDTAGNYHIVALTLATTDGSPVVIDEFKYLPNTEVWTRANDNDAEGYHQYDSADVSIIDYHLQQIAAARIDFVLFDISNGGLGGASIHMDWYGNDNRSPVFFVANMQIACARIKAWNDSHSWKIKYAIAAGPYNVQEAANDVYDHYYMNSAYGGPDNYYQIQDGAGGVNKPLLVYHATGSLPTDSRFALRLSGGGPNAPISPDWYGWWAPSGGPVYDPEAVMIAPGQDNHSGSYVGRNYGQYYSGAGTDSQGHLFGWNRILTEWAQTRPKVVIIEDFNDYIEDTGEWAADTTYLDPEPISIGSSGVVGRDEQWRAVAGGPTVPWFYWDLTVSNINNLRVASPLYKLVNTGTGEVLDGNQKGVDADPFLSNDTATAAQLWRVVYLGSGLYRLANNLTGLWLDSNLRYNGQSPRLENYFDFATQQWRIIPVGDGLCKLLTDDGSSLALDAAGRYNGASPYFSPYTYSGLQSQKWRLMLSDLVAWLPADNNSLDVVGNVYGSLQGPVGYSDGRVGQAFNFNGQGSYEDVRISDRPTLRLAGSLTLEAWIKPSQLGAWQNVITKWDGCFLNPQQKSYVLGMDPNNHIYAGVSSDGTDAGSISAGSLSAIPSTDWTHVAGTFDGTSMRMYVNGALENTASFAGPKSIFQGSDDLAIGAVLGGCSGTAYWMFQGLIDDTRIHYRALSSSEVLASYNTGKGLVAWWRAENNAYDSVGALTDTLEGGITFPSGKIGNAFSLNGYNQDVRVPDRAALHLSGGMTLTAWISPAQNTIWQNIIAKWDGCYDLGQRSYSFGLNPDGHVFVGCSRDGTDAGARSVTSASVIPTTGWTHVAGTYDGTVLRIYVNGVFEASTSFGTVGNIFQGIDDLSIGAVVGGCASGQMGYPFHGLMDEVRIYSRALSDTEVTTLYNTGSP